MENILLILAVVGGIIYKIYENYQEEMEKARKRKTTMPPPYQQQQVDPPHPVVPKKQPMPDPVVLYEEAREVIKKTAETSRKDIKKIRKKLDDIRVTTTTQRAHEEATQRLEQDRARRLALQGRPESEKNQQLEVIDLDQYEFDLRDAIIKSAILDRPYQD